MWSMVIRNKDARRVSPANELVQEIAIWEIKKTTVMETFGDKNMSDDRHTVLWGHKILKRGTLKWLSSGDKWGNQGESGALGEN